jgi:hypothetical protein
LYIFNGPHSVVVVVLVVVVAAVEVVVVVVVVVVEHLVVVVVVVDVRVVVVEVVVVVHLVVVVEVVVVVVVLVVVVVEQNCMFNPAHFTGIWHSIPEPLLPQSSKSGGSCVGSMMVPVYLVASILMWTSLASSGLSKYGSRLNDPAHSAPLLLYPSSWQNVFQSPSSSLI